MFNGIHPNLSAGEAGSFSALNELLVCMWCVRAWRLELLLANRGKSRNCVPDASSIFVRTLTPTLEVMLVQLSLALQFC